MESSQNEEMLKKAALSVKPYSELYRPQFHFSPPWGWCNDPNGLVYFEGEYHLFYQYNPDDIVWGPMYWAHAVSGDLIHWQNLPIALEPDNLGTIFSGSIVVDEHDTSGFFDGNSGLVAIFTQHLEKENQPPLEQQSIAYSRDKGRTWIKYKNNPVIKNDKTKAFLDFRDPKVFWDNRINKWIMIVGGGIFRFFHSENLKKWTFVSEPGLFEEFPDLFEFPVDGDQNNRKWVMSLAGYGYHIGSFDGNRFLAESEYIPADYGYSWQAAYSYNNLPDRRIWLAFMRDAGKGPTYPWRNNMSIPRKLELKTCKAGIRMIQKPIKELEQLRKNHSSFRDTYLNSSINVLKDLNKDIFEIDAEFCIEKPVEFGFKLRKGNGVETIIKYLPESGMAVVDIINASDPKYDKCAGSLGHHFFDLQFPIRVFSRCYQAYYRGEGNNLSIRIFVDVSSIETFFGNGEVVFSNSIYPPPDCKGMELYALGDGIRLSRCDIYDLESIWRG